MFNRCHQQSCLPPAMSDYFFLLIFSIFIVECRRDVMNQTTKQQADLESFRQLSQLQHSHNNVSQGSYRGVKSLATPRSGRLSNVSVNVGGGGGHKNSTLRAARRETSIIRAHRKLRKKLASSSTASHHHGLSLGKAPPPLLPTYSSQSFRSRRRAANLLG